MPVTIDGTVYWSAPASVTYAALGGVGLPLTFIMDRGQQDVSVVVVSDSTGDVAAEWPTLWASKLAAQYPEFTVRIRYWLTATNDYGAFTTLQTGTGNRTLDVHNFGISGQNASIISSFFATAFTVPFPVAASSQAVPGPTMIVISNGHNMNLSVISSRQQMLQQIRRIRAHYPSTAIVLTGQNPKTPATPLHAEGLVTAGVMLELAASEGLGHINVMQAFFDVGDYSSLVPDGTHPNDAGSELWATEVDKHFRRGSRAQPIKQRDSLDTITLPAASFSPSIGTPVLGVPASGIVPGWLMDDATQEAVVTAVALPSHWRGAQIKLRIAHNGIAGTGVSRWKVEVGRLRVDSFQSSINGFNQTVSAPAGGQFGIVTADITNPTTLALADYFGSIAPASTDLGTPELLIRVSRMGADAADVAVGDLAFVTAQVNRTH